MESQIENRVQNSSLATIDLEELYLPGERVFFDLKPLLFQELVLKEKDFRESIRKTNWTTFSGKHVAIGCTADAIIPTWAYMLLTIALHPYASTVFFGSVSELERELYRKQVSRVDWEKYRALRVVIKGCSKIDVPTEIYVDVTARLNDVAASIMYGEPCSTVPLYKRPK